MLSTIANIFAALTARVSTAVSTKREGGATSVEYALIVALIAIIIIVAVTFLGTNLSAIFQKVGNAV